MRGRLNLFQRTMLRWCELHPYSAVHAARLPVPLDPARLQADIAQELQALGLTGLDLDARHGRFEYAGGPAHVELKVLRGGEPYALLEREFEAQLNAPFPRAGAHLEPFRFFAVEAGTACYLGFAYDHFIAGGDSIVVLMQRLAQRHLGGSSATRSPLGLYPQTFGRLFARYPKHAILGLPNLPRFLASCRRSFRSPLSAKTDPHNAFRSSRIEPRNVAALLHASEAWGITFNDLLLALVLLALSPVAAPRAQAARRRELSVASIMNIRREFQPDAERMFGQFLSYFRVSHPVPLSIGVRQLAADVHTETTRIKSGKLYLQTLLALGASGLAWRLLTPERRSGFFAKTCPVWAGVTTLNINALWNLSELPRHSVDYVRAASTGPLSPLIFAISTFGEAAHLGVIYRPDVFSRGTIDTIVGEFFRWIETLE